ncbi:MAG TPA: hypothetical protein ENN87_11120 [Phycisphaerales bacterium]|nr:hypothetical protein [Phycisphaerales bacterium]
MYSAKKRYLVAMGIWWTLCIAVMLGLGVLVVLPQKERLADLANQTHDVAQRLAHAQEAGKPQTQARVQAEMTELKQRLADFTVRADSASSLTFQIGQLADMIQLKDLTSKRKEGLSQDKLEGFRNLGEVWLEVAFKGDFWQFAQFINQLERHEPVVFVETFNIKRDIRGGQAREAEVSLCFLVQSESVAKL